MRIATMVTLAAISAASAANASLPPNGGLANALTSEKEYLDELAPHQLSSLIDILNEGAVLATDTAE